MRFGGFMVEYKAFEALARNETEGLDYRIGFRNGNSGIAVMAIHGGGIEPGTTEIADAVAGDDHTFYSFEGLKPQGNRVLHLKSVGFDEPLGRSLVLRSRKVITIHGCHHHGKSVFVGGRDAAAKAGVKQGLESAGFSTLEDPRLAGKSPQNVCNQGAGGPGVQLEIPIALRALMFRDFRCARRSGDAHIFTEFVTALRRVLEGF
jgi:phage replication-related protein YjqB (UPF0714/DUF867 family)